jgi:transcriptional regulator with XRE-family HTH domain
VATCWSRRAGGAGISQAELARRSGVAASLIGRYERREVVPSLERLQALVRACGLELSFRLGNLDTTGHDRALIERELRHTPGERLRRGLAAGRAFRAVAAEGRARALSTRDPPDAGATQRPVRAHRCRRGAGCGAPVVTEDIDITPAPDETNLRRLTEALRKLNARPRTGRDTDPFALPVDPELLATGRIWTLTTTAGDLDLCFMPAGTRGYDDLRRDAMQECLGGGLVVTVASLRDVIRSKRRPAARRTWRSCRSSGRSST